ncbi:hypothetical protein GHT06_016148 [Daphnia sinensis]|uniref:Uncharacterized protein n=1 Tax=Daphnia sinensis TaxID=1820382 RepID=A0AAD5KTN9_9CRUS|nr:hypothetical protein GHT06_016148 [Daphnia sinensis]
MAIKLPSKLLIIFTMIFSCCWLFLLICTLNDDNGHWQYRQDETNGFDSAEQDYDVCTGDLLDKCQYHFEKEEDGNYRFMSDQNGPCRLVRYTTDRIVSCFDCLHYASQLDGNSNSSNRLYVVFMGDSRVRHQFYNFVRLIPDYDQTRQPLGLSSSFHGDIEITSNILRLRLSFKWRPLINDSVVETVRGWTTTDPSERPHLVFLGMVVHHMIGENGTNYQLYEEKMAKFAPELAQLANVTQLIWFNQYPVLDSYHHNHDSNKNIYSEKEREQWYPHMGFV